MLSTTLKVVIIWNRTAKLRYQSMLAMLSPAMYVQEHNKACLNRCSYLAPLCNFLSSTNCKARIKQMERFKFKRYREENRKSKNLENSEKET